jgi:uncharacterized cupin superfamily protein/catechol 2,3-dioxygenase-like lactoylglutathione lyase family enzyme
VFDHVKFGVSDYAASKAFFLKALEPLGVKVASEGPPTYGVELIAGGDDSLCLYQTEGKPAPLHLAFTAATREQVEAFHRAALAAGGRDNGAPGLRPNYHADYYAAFVIGPDGHNIEAVCHEPLQPPTLVARHAAAAPARIKLTNYPQPFAARMTGREKRPLGDLFGLSNFGVNLTRLAPQAISALRHAHSKQDEFVYILQGHPTLCTDEGRTRLGPGMCAGFKAGTGNGHQLVNETGQEVVYLEVGDRTSGDEASYPDDDLKAALEAGRWKFVHKDGTPYA